MIITTTLARLIEEIIPLLFGRPPTQVYTAADIKTAAEIRLLNSDTRGKLAYLTEKHEIIVEWVPVVRIYEKH